jgi:hypothetical protein
MSARGRRPEEGRGRADLHVHTRASDGTATVAEVLAAAVAAGLHVVAITDHERIDAALAARQMARDEGLPLEVVVGEEVTTRGGHLLALFVGTRILPWRSLRATVIAIHEAGGLAIPAHPFAPYPLCAQEGAVRRLLEDPDPAARPDALEVFNPTILGRAGGGRPASFARAVGLAAVAGSDAHAAEAIGQAVTLFPGRSAGDLRRAIVGGQTEVDGRFHDPGSQLLVFGRQLRKYGRDLRDELARLWGLGPGRDVGYPRRAIPAASGREGDRDEALGPTSHRR